MGLGKDPKTPEVELIAPEKALKLQFEIHSPTPKDARYYHLAIKIYNSKIGGSFSLFQITTISHCALPGIIVFVVDYAFLRLCSAFDLKTA
jgi:hypothetical protein